MEKDKTEKPGIVAQIIALELEAGAKYEIPSLNLTISKEGVISNENERSED